MCLIFLACTWQNWTRLLPNLYGSLCWWLNLYFSWWLESHGVPQLPFRVREDKIMGSWISLLIVLCIPWDFIFHMLCSRLIFSFFSPIAWWVGKMGKLLEHFLWLRSIERNTDSSHFLVPKGDIFTSRWFHYDFVFKNMYVIWLFLIIWNSSSRSFSQTYKKNYIVKCKI